MHNNSSVSSRGYTYLAEVSVAEQILWKISKFLGELSMRKQVYQAFFLSAHSLEPGNEAGVLPGGRALDDEV